MKRNNGKLLNKEKIQKKLDLRYPNRYEVISEYYGKDEPITVRHLEGCNKIFNTTYHQIYSGKQYCPNCKEERKRKKLGYDINSLKNKMLLLKDRK